MYQPLTKKELEQIKREDLIRNYIWEHAQIPHLPINVSLLRNQMNNTIDYIKQHNQVVIDPFYSFFDDIDRLTYLPKYLTDMLEEVSLFTLCRTIIIMAKILTAHPAQENVLLELTNSISILHIDKQLRALSSLYDGN